MGGKQPRFELPYCYTNFCISLSFDQARHFYRTFFNDVLIKDKGSF